LQLQEELGFSKSSNQTYRINFLREIEAATIMKRLQVKVISLKVKAEGQAPKQVPAMEDRRRAKIIWQWVSYVSDFIMLPT
jgi:hypothetical protein